VAKWVVIRYRFNEDMRLWEYDSVVVFHDDESLLKYLKSQAKRANDYRYEITTVRGQNRLGG